MTHALPWLREAGFTQEVGSFVANEIARVALTQEHATDAEREIYQEEQMVRMHEIFKAKTEAKIKAARWLVERLDRQAPGLVELLERTGAGNSADVIAQLALQAEKLRKRRPAK